MRALEQIRAELGPDLFGKALAAYGSSEASEDDDLFFHSSLSQATYALVRAARNTLNPSTLELAENPQETELQGSEKEVEQLAYLLFGLLRLENAKTTPENERGDIRKVLAVIFKNPSLFVISDENTDNYELFNLFQRIRTFYENKTP